MHNHSGGNSKILINYQQWLNYAQQKLAQNQANDPYLNPKIDALALLSFVANCDRVKILAFAETCLSENQLEQLEQLLSRRVQGEPIAYILAQKEFWSLDLQVSPATLIPRPDTEILVEQALEQIEIRINSPYFDGQLDILDLGTGSGAIALALAYELNNKKRANININIVGVDKCPQAVALAYKNAQKHQLPVCFLESDWFANLTNRKFDLIVSNPPYIDAQDKHLHQGDVRFEPASALISAQQGYADLFYLIEKAKYYLKPRGALVLEHGWQQGEKVRDCFCQNLWLNIKTINDYGNNERVTLAHWDNN